MTGAKLLSGTGTIEWGVGNGGEVAYELMYKVNGEEFASGVIKGDPILIADAATTSRALRLTLANGMTLDVEIEATGDTTAAITTARLRT